ncbi:YdgA family protein [Zooshikella harenae]|uniref:YdgA family protein n=1 Tax=Zooshikella harenae TaxID=2827238 RepID=A0ABS5ZBP4_9GAMM|nr:YdgA family protein [Zooshikella harenae]MBU2711183.1 YdgA family protein [Zooshikella harenae]
MKKLLFIIVILAAVVTGGPFVSGIQAEKHYNASVVQLEQALSEYQHLLSYSIQKNYQRGWFKSQASTELQITPKNEAPITINMQHSVQHGPVFWGKSPLFGLASTTTDLQYSAEAQKTIKMLWKDKKPLVISSVTGFSGETTFDIKLTPFTLEEGGNIVEVKPAQINASITPQADKLTASGEWQGMSLTSQDGKLQVGKMTFSSDKSRALETLWVGDDKADIDYMTVTDPSGASFREVNLQGFSMVSHSELQAEAINANANLRFAAITIDEEKLASDVILNLKLNNIAAKPLVAIQQVVTNWQQQAMQQTNPTPPDFTQLQPHLQAILKQGPSIEISKLHAETQKGNVDADLLATIKTDNPMLLSNPLFMLGAIQAKANVSLPKALLMESPMAPQLDMYIQQGVLKEEAGQLKAKVNFTEGSLTINDKKMM